MLSNNRREILKTLRRHQRSVATHMQSVSGTIKSLWWDAESCKAKGIYPERWTPKEMAIYETKMKIYAEVIPVIRECAEEADALLRAESCSDEQYDDFVKRNRARSTECAIKMEAVGVLLNGTSCGKSTRGTR